MTTDHHDPHAFGAPLTAAEMNAPLGQLDAAISAISTTAYNVLDYGAVGNGVADDTAAINAAIAALPAYSSGVGGGTVVFPPGAYKVTSAITLTSGVRLLGAGMRASRITGSLSGPLITTPTDGSAAPISFYQSIDSLFVNNTSSNSAARAVKIVQAANVLLMRSSFQGVAGYIVHLVGSILVDVISCKIGGAVGANAAVYVDGTTASGGCNGIRLIGNSISDAKSGLLAITTTALTVIGNQFEEIAGSAPTYDGGVICDSVFGGTITGNYFETIHASGIAFYGAVAINSGVSVGGNYFYNTASPVIAMSNLKYGTITSNHMAPGAIEANPHGVVGAGANCKGNTIAQQNLTSGTGISVSLDAAALGNTILAPNGVTTLAYSASMTPDLTLGSIHEITVTNGTGMTVLAAAPKTNGARMTLVFINSSGGAMGAVTAPAYFSAGAWPTPANGKRAAISFYCAGVGFAWTETGRTGDMP